MTPSSMSTGPTIIESNKPDEHVETLTGAPEKKLSKAELKRLQAYEERKRRLINQGTKPEDVDRIIAQQDYDALPPDKKIKRIEKVMSGLFQSFQTQIVEMAQQISNINYNQNQLADVLAINLKAIEKIVKKLGLTDEQFAATIKEAEDELNAEIKAAQEKREAEAKKAAEEAEKKSIVDGANSTAADDAPFVPEEATVFGGD